MQELDDNTLPFEGADPGKERLQLLPIEDKNYHRASLWSFGKPVGYSSPGFNMQPPPLRCPGQMLHEAA